jgi:arabinan endo-1,5-alpha-L-arabinosidase
MKRCSACAVIFILPVPSFALDGQLQIHEPATIVQCEVKYYTYGTGGAALVSDDGWTWRRGTTPVSDSIPRNVP